MDYGKKYKEALERARVWKDKSGMPADKQCILDDIFPELCELEDEKIRKGLINYFNHHKNGINIFYGIKGDDILAWLEKQGEQKSQRMISAEAKEAMYGKPAWTKEDDVRLKVCIDALQAESLMGKVDTVMTKWLKSLKQRIEGRL